MFLGPFVCGARASSLCSYPQVLRARIIKPASEAQEEVEGSREKNARGALRLLKYNQRPLHLMNKVRKQRALREGKRETGDALLVCFMERAGGGGHKQHTKQNSTSSILETDFSLIRDSFHEPLKYLQVPKSRRKLKRSERIPPICLTYTGTTSQFMECCCSACEES